MTRKLLIIIRKAPGSSSLPAAALDLALTAAAFEQEVTLLFSGAGILHLLSGQQQKISQALPSLELYDIKRILYVQEAMAERKLSPNDLLMPVQAIPTLQLNREIEEADLVFNF